MMLLGPFQQTIQQIQWNNRSCRPSLTRRLPKRSRSGFTRRARSFGSSNPTAKFTAGETILVPNVEPFVLPTDADQAAARAEAKAIMEASKPVAGTAGRTSASQQPQTTASVVQKEPVVVTVSKSSSSLTVARPDGSIVLFAPVTTEANAIRCRPASGRSTPCNSIPRSATTPTCSGTRPVALESAHQARAARLAWCGIDLSKEHYGLHGSPEPSKIGHTQSHGCVRLTNWDATRLAKLVAPGTQVIFTE